MTYDLVPPGRGGYSLLDGIQGCSKVLGCFFVIFGISMGGFLFQIQCVQFAKLGAFSKIWPKNPQSDGSQNHTFRGIEMVEILKSTLSIPVQNLVK